MANRTYLVATFITAANLVLQVVLLFIVAGPREYEVGHSFASLLGFWTLFSIVAMFVFAQLFLWLSMLWVLMTYDSPLHLGWFVLVLFTLSLGASVYYLSRYRRIAARLATA